MMEDTFVVA